MKDSRHVFFRRQLAEIAICASLVALSACSTPLNVFYTLESDDAIGAQAKHVGSPLLIELVSVTVPSELARTEFVVQTGQTQVDVLEQTRWASPPADEIRSALSQDLTRELGAIDVSGSPHVTNSPVYQVSMAVQRFESWPDSHTVFDAVWSIRLQGTQLLLTCRNTVTNPISTGSVALVQGHRRAIEEVAANIARGIASLETTKKMPASPIDACATGACIQVQCPL